MSRIPVILPDLGNADQRLSISAWFVEPNDAIDAEDCLAEVLMSGVTCDVAAPASGTVTRIEKQVGDPVKPGDVLAWIEID